jgi:hypothetical protein
MIVVISIILIILGLVLPAANTLWQERKSAEAENTIQGLFMTARAKALEAGAVETGLFFFVDKEGVQRIVTIARLKPLTLQDASGQPCSNPTPNPFAYDRVFRITEERDYVLPAPIRAVPRYVVEDHKAHPNDPWNAFSPDELCRQDFNASVANNSDQDQAQRHRNYFAVVFDTDGQLLVGRDVLIYDKDEDGNNFGDRTHLSVGPGPCPDVATTVNYHARAGAAQPIDPTGADEAVPFLIEDDKSIAINFPSVDGLLVYDDSLFTALPGQTPEELEAKRDFLLRTGQPFYISRWTGVVVRGPRGENVVPEP